MEFLTLVHILKIRHQKVLLQQSYFSNNKGSGIETSKKAYNQGYSDGRTGYGLPASQQASANDYYLARGLNYSSADKVGVYVMGYNDGINGRAKRY